MALSVVELRRSKALRTQRNILRVTFDAAYVTGGEPLTLAQLGLRAADVVNAQSSGGYIFEYDYVNQKLKAYYANYPGAAAGPLVEVANATDLSAISTRVVAEGI